MNLPSLPTDNLYKFLAIGGVALIVAGLVLPYSFVRSNAERTRGALNVRTEQFSKFLDDTLSLAERREKTYEDVLKDASEALSDADKDVAHMRVSAAKVRLNAVDKRDIVWDTRAKIEEQINKAFLAELEQTLLLTKWITQVAAVMANTGFAFAAIGFPCWWWKVQRFHDRIIRAEAAKAEKELSAAPVTGK